MVLIVFCRQMLGRPISFEFLRFFAIELLLEKIFCFLFGFSSDATEIGVKSD